MKSIQYFIIIVFILSMTQCGSSKKIYDGDWEETADPMKELNEFAGDIIQKGGVAAVGEGRSRRRDLAKEKARANATGALAEIFGKKIDRLKKTFQEEVGSGKESEINEMFTIATKSLTSEVLVGAIEMNSKVLKNDEEEYLYGVVMGITPSSINSALIQELKKADPNLYQRFRSSKAFEELNDSLDKK